MDSRLALTVVGPSGARYHLVYTAGQGWQLVDLPSTTTVVKVKSSVDLAPLFTPTSGEVQPQTVFIDGPTGYTFVWVAEGGWKFVGNIAPLTKLAASQVECTAHGQGQVGSIQ